MYKIEKIDTVTAPEETIEKILDYVEKAAKQYNPEDPPVPRETLKETLRRSNPTHKIIKFFAFDEKGNVVGEARISHEKLEIDTNPEYCDMYVRVLQEHSGKGVGTKLLTALVKEAEKMKKTKAIIWIRQGKVKHHAKQWVEKIGFKQALIEYVNVLYPENVDLTAIDNLIQQKLKRNKDLHFKIMTQEQFNQKILEDDKFCEEMADFFTETSNLVPRGDTEEKDFIITPKDMKKNAETSLKTKTWSGINIIAMKEGRAIGYSETFYSPVQKEKPAFYTGNTAVRKAYQGRGIATILKALMVKELVKRNFASLRTENANTNQVMLHINYKIGFKKNYEWLKYEGTIEQIKKYLKNKNAL